MTLKTSATKTIKLKKLQKEKLILLVQKIPGLYEPKKKKKHSDKQYLNNVRVKISKEISFFFVVFDASYKAMSFLCRINASFNFFLRTVVHFV